MKEESQFTKVMDALTPLGLTINWLLLPFFIYEINKSRRRKTPIGIGLLLFGNMLSQSYPPKKEKKDNEKKNKKNKKNTKRKSKG